MKISLITATLNSAEVLADNLASVRAQQSDFDFEHIIQDGGSSDGTMKLLEDYQASVPYPVLIEVGRDKGFYDAINKGLRRASGEVIGLLNSDDWFASNDVLTDVVKCFNEGLDINIVYGNLDYVKPGVSTGVTDSSGMPFKVVRRWRSSRFSVGKLKGGWMPPHPTVYVRREVYEKAGDYRLDVGSAADYEWLLRVFLGPAQPGKRLAARDKKSVLYMPKIMVHMRLGGQSNVSLKSRLVANYMDRYAWTINNYKPWPFLRVLKPLRKGGQWYLSKRISGIKRIVISELFYPEQNATGYFMTLIAESLVREGEEVLAICAQPSYNQRGIKAPKIELRHGVQIHRCLSSTCDPYKFGGRLLNFLTNSFSIAWRSLFSVKRGDKVLVVTNPPLLPFLIRLICWMKGAKYVLLVHDVYPDVLVALGFLRANNPLCRMMSWINGRLYSSAHVVVALNRDMTHMIEAKSNGQAKVLIIPNWGDVKEIHPEKKGENRFLKEFNLQEKFIVNYSGNHGYTHDMLSIIKAANILRKEEDIHFLFFGEGSGKAAMVKRSNELGLDNVTFKSFVDRSELNTSLNAADVCIVSLKNDMNGVSVPSRIYNIMAAGKPILGNVETGSEVAELIQHNNLGVVVPPKSPQLLAAKILELKNDPVLCNQMGENSRRQAVEKYSYSIIKEQFRAVFEEL